MIDGTGPYRGVVFLHIPKTAGTSVRIALERICKKRLHVHPGRTIVRYSDEDLAHYDLIHGHMMAYHLDRPVFRDYLHLVVVRDPLDRFLSAHGYARVAVDNPTAAQQFAATVGPFEYFASGLGTERHALLHRLGLESQDEKDATPLLRLLQRAKERLSTMVVGVVPHLAPLLDYTARQLGREAPAEVPRENVTPKEHKHHLITERQLAIMRHVLRYDYELFNCACERANALYGLPEPLPMARRARQAANGRRSSPSKLIKRG